MPDWYVPKEFSFVQGNTMTFKYGEVWFPRDYPGEARVYIQGHDDADAELSLLRSRLMGYSFAIGSYGSFQELRFAPVMAPMLARTISNFSERNK